MTLNGWSQIALILALVFLAAVPLGGFIAAIARGERNVLTSILGPLERFVLRASGVNAQAGMGWRGYTAALMVINATHFALLYLMLRFQDWLPLDPQGFSGLSPKLAFNTAISFVTNTN